MKNSNRVIAVAEGKILLFPLEPTLPNDDFPYRLPFSSELMIPDEAHVYDFDDFSAVSLNEISYAGKECTLEPLRRALASMPSLYSPIAKGAQWVNWNSVSRYCPKDGNLLTHAQGAYFKKCPHCETEYFPRLDAAIVVLVKRGEEALLVHARNLRPGVMALVAGFVECGESLEECVAREVMEETGLVISDVRYVGSQAWPFPNQLMLGFVADYKAGEITFRDDELDKAGFFRRDNPPVIPNPPSLTSRIIRNWIDGCL